MPTPRERLRHAFSSEIPENMMDAARAARRRSDDYARAHPQPPERRRRVARAAA